VALDAPLLEQALRTRDRVLDAQHELDRARADYEHLVRRLVAGGGTIREVGAALGISHQRVHQIVDAEPIVAPRPRAAGDLLLQIRPRRRVERAFVRLDEASRELLAAGQREALALGHDVLGAEHVLLALAALDRPGGAALRGRGLGPERVREAIVAAIGAGPRAPEGTRRRSCVEPGEMPLSPHLKRVLHAGTKVAPPGQPIRPEHLLIALARVPDTVAARIFAEASVDEPAIVNAYIRLDGD